MTVFILLVFAAVYFGMALGRWPGLRIDRTGIALVGAILLFLGGALTPAAVLAAIDFSTLLMLFGLMILSAQFAEAGLYDHVAARLASARRSGPLLLALVIAVGGLLSAVLINDVVVFAMTPLLCRGMAARGGDPRPWLIGLACAANAGSAATLIGNPQNILIGSAGNLGFAAFLEANGPPALLALLAVWAVIVFQWRKELRVPSPEVSPPLPALDHGALAKAALALVLLLSVFLLDLPRVAGVLVVAGLLLLSRKQESRRLMAQVDWPLLVLFAALFAVTEAVSASGTLAGLGRLAESDGDGVLAGLALAGSNTIGNVPMVMLLLSHAGAPSSTWLTGLALFSTLAGNLLLVGSIANIIVAERAGCEGIRLGFLDHARSGIPVTLLSLAVALAWRTWLTP